MVGRVVGDIVTQLLGERVSVTETVRVATLLDTTGEGDRVIETDIVRVTVRVNGFVVTTGLPVTVIVLETETVIDGDTVFVAKLLVGRGDPVNVTEDVKEPLGERWALTLPVRVADCLVLPDTLPVARLADTVGDPVTDCIIVGLTLTEPVLLRMPLGVTTEVDELMLGVTLSVELLVGLDVTTGLGDPRGVAVAHCDMEEDTLLDPVGL